MRIFSALVLSLSLCSTAAMANDVVGAVVGAAGGAVVGNQLGGTQGAVVGGVAGGVLGVAVSSLLDHDKGGHHHDHGRPGPAPAPRHGGPDHGPEHFHHEGEGGPRP
ncbi:glycine zipper domain-containing protein [gamma proteobacterium L18]